MDVNAIVSLISNVGFPVAVCIALFFYMEKQNERHQNETDKLNETVQSNTKVLTELCTLIKTLIKRWKKKTYITGIKQKLKTKILHYSHLCNVFFV